MEIEGALIVGLRMLVEGRERYDVRVGQDVTLEVSLVALPGEYTLEVEVDGERAEDTFLIEHPGTYKKTAFWTEAGPAGEKTVRVRVRDGRRVLSEAELTYFVRAREPEPLERALPALLPVIAGGAMVAGGAVGR